MSERLDEAKGNVKKGVGRLTGDQELEAEGETEATSAKAARETKGAVHEVAGSVKEGLGRLTGDETIEAEGEADRLKGKTERLG